jgi:hypothetical protein
MHAIDNVAHVLAVFNKILVHTQERMMTGTNIKFHMIYITITPRNRIKDIFFPH